MNLLLTFFQAQCVQGLRVNIGSNFYIWFIRSIETSQGREPLCREHFDAETTCSRRLLPPSKWMFDFLHIYYTAGGCAALEISAILRAAETCLQQGPEDFASLLRELPWQVPGHVLGLQGPAARARLLHSSRFPDKSYKGKAAHVMQLLPIIPCLCELLDEENKLQQYLSSFEALLETHRELRRLARQGGIMETSRLQDLQRRHQALFLAAYQDDLLKPKHHWRHHAAQQIAAWGAYIDTSACEAKHQVYKGAANKNMDVLVSSPDWSKAVLTRMLCTCFEQLETHFDNRARTSSGQERQFAWGQQTLRTFSQVQWQGLHWKKGDFQLAPFPGMVLHCCLNSGDKPFLLLEEYQLEEKQRFSGLFRATRRMRTLQDLPSSHLASWWLVEEAGLVRAVR